MTLNELVKLAMLWTTRSWSLIRYFKYNAIKQAMASRFSLLWIKFTKINVFSFILEDKCCGRSLETSLIGERIPVNTNKLFFLRVIPIFWLKAHICASATHTWLDLFADLDFVARICGKRTLSTLHHMHTELTFQTFLRLLWFPVSAYGASLVGEKPTFQQRLTGNQISATELFYQHLHQSVDPMYIAYTQSIRTP